MNASTPKLTSFLSRWMGVSTSGAPERAPMQLVALEERVLYSAGPIPAEVLDADLMSQGDFQGVDAHDLGLNAFDTDPTSTFEYLQQQIDAANSLDLIDDIQPLEIAASDLDDADSLGIDSIDSLSNEFANIAADNVDALTVAADLQSSERVTAAVSIEINSVVSISGRVLHDVDGDGDVDEQLGLGGVEVRLYTDFGNELLGDGDLDNPVQTRTTSESGEYEFTDLEVGETYFVVVNGSTLGSQLDYNFNFDANEFFNNNNVFGEQTYASEGALFDRGDGQEFTTTDGAFFGGRTTDGSDAARDLSNTGGFEHVIRSFETTENQTDVDFGFSFNVVTNTRGGDLSDDDPSSDRSIQGSLRQFIVNANAIVGDNAMRFVPIVDPTFTSEFTFHDIYQIDVVNALPVITDAGTSINGIAYQTDGLELERFEATIAPEDLDSAFGVDDNLLGPKFLPSLELSGLRGDSGNAGLVAINAANFEVSNLALLGFRTGISIVGEDSFSASIHDNFIGVHADGSRRFQNAGEWCFGE